MPISQSIIPSTQISQQQDKRKSIINDEISTNNGISPLVNTFHQTFGGENGNRSSRSSSVSSAQPVVSNLIKIYSEATTSKSQKTDNIKSTGKHDELIKIFQQASNQNQQRRTSSSPIIKQPSQAREEAYEEITWDNLVHG
jgi:hypothetical protein